MCSFPKDLPKCIGYRCPLGECISKDRLCDGKSDCRDKSDEREDLCRERKKCAPNELQCGDGTCKSKTKFCDKVSDCADGSDEPTTCTCLEYLM